MSKRKLPVLITTDKDKRGVFFAHINEEDMGKEDIVAENIQMCVYWSSDVHGVLGLASGGPTSTCRITAPVSRGVIKGVTFVSEVSKKAATAWKKQPWG